MKLIDGNDDFIEKKDEDVDHFYYLRDGDPGPDKKEYMECEVESLEELEELNRGLDQEQNPNRRWVPVISRLEGNNRVPSVVINKFKYNELVQAGSVFEPGEDYRNAEDDFVSYVIDQKEPEHFRKIVVFGDKKLRDLIINILNNSFNARNAEAKIQTGGLR